MIREWCEGCGDHLCSRVDWDGETRLFCRDMCGSSDGPTIYEVAEAFWSAIAHERAECECLVKEARSEGLEEGLRRGPGPVVRFPEYFGYNGAVIDEIKTLHGGLLAAPLDHIVASCETLVALARRVVGPEEAERLRLEIEALEHDATPSDIRAEHDATPSDIRAEHDATPSEKGNG